MSMSEMKAVIVDGEEGWGFDSMIMWIAGVTALMSCGLEACSWGWNWKGVLCVVEAGVNAKSQATKHRGDHKAISAGRFCIDAQC